MNSEVSSGFGVFGTCSSFFSSGTFLFSCFALLHGVPDYMQPGGRQAAEKERRPVLDKSREGGWWGVRIAQCSREKKSYVKVNTQQF